MQLLKERILSEGQILGDDVLKVDMFLNHQIDVALLDEMGKEFYRLFENRGINKIVTIESSGIAIACMAAKYFQVPVVFAKKGKSRNIGDDLYISSVYSFTRLDSYLITVSKKYLSGKDNLLIIDDFLANGHALSGIMDIANQAGAHIEGIGIAIEKAFQGGGDRLRKKGLDIQSLAVIQSIDNGKITFADDQTEKI